MRPPTPESNTPIGRASIARMIRASPHTDALQTWATLAAVTAPAARVLLFLVAAVAAVLVASGPAGAFSRQDVTITSADGTALAATLTLPDGAAPAGGWPAVIFMHGLGGNRVEHARGRPADGHRRPLRRARLRRARARAVGRADRDRRPEGDRRREGGLRVAARPAGRLRHADRRLGRLLRRRRGVELARGRCSVGRARDLDELDRPPRRASPAGAREDRRDRRLPRLARPEARRPGGARDPRCRLSPGALRRCCRSPPHARRSRP